MFKPKI